MAHECEICGDWCWCDMDDTGGLEQPNDCPHFARHDNEPEEAEEFAGEDHKS